MYFYGLNPGSLKRDLSLRQVFDFIIVNSSQHSEFDAFKRQYTHPDYSFLPTNPLLKYWSNVERAKPLPTVLMFGKQYFKLHYTDMDHLCEWVLKTRDIMETHNGQSQEDIITVEERKQQTGPSSEVAEVEKQKEARGSYRNSTGPIDADVYMSKIDWPKSWLTHLKVNTYDKHILTTPGEWLSDSIINAAVTLLKVQYPFLSGLQDVNLGLTNSYNVETGEFIQILHNGSNHWNVASTIGV